jgi:hypothetical protein
VESQSQRREARRRQIGERIAAIRARIGELQQARRENTHPVASREQFVEAQHHAALSEVTAAQALNASIGAFLRAAEAHERAAVQHEHAAATGDGEEHRRERAAFHRAAAAADRKRAETARSLLSRDPG